MTDSPPQDKKKRNKWLLLIASYKTLQAILFALIGLGARHMLHKDVGDELALLVDHLRFNPESRLINFLIDKASLVSDPVLTRIGILAFAYSGISYVEGIGLYFERVWAEYLTLIITASFLPWEILEIFRSQTWFRFSLLAVNLLVFWYLLQLLIIRGHHKPATTEKPADEAEN